MTKRFGSMKVILTDNANKHHSYIIFCCVFDPKTPVNILGVPSLGTFIGDHSDATDLLAEDGTTIKSGTKNHISFGIMAGMSGVLFMDLDIFYNYISLSVIAISQLSAPDYINFSQTKCTSLFPQPILSTRRLVM